MIPIAFFLAGAFSFQGGNLNDLVDALFDQRQLPVVALASSSPQIKPFRIDARLANDPKDFVRLLKAKAHIEAIVDGGIGLSDGQLSFEGQAPDPAYGHGIPRLNIETLPPDSLKDGKLSIHSASDGSFVVKDLTNLAWSKPLTIYWYFQNFRFLSHTKDCSEPLFLSSLASAIGAKFREDAKGYHLELDPGSWRKRAIASIDTGNGPPTVGLPENIHEAGFQVAKALYRQVTNDQIQQAFDLRTGMVVKSLNGEVEQAMRQKAVLLKQYYDQCLANGTDGIEVHVMGMIDWERPPYGVLLRPFFGTPVEFWRKGGGSVPD